MKPNEEKAVLSHYTGGWGIAEIARRTKLPYDEVRSVISKQGDDFRRLNGPESHRASEWYSNAEMTDAIREAHRDVHNDEEPLTMPEYEEWRGLRARPAGITITRRFGKWCIACDEAGVPCTPRKRREGTTKTQCAMALIEARERLGHYPSYNEYGDLWHDQLKEDGYPSGPTIRVKFGKWREALRNADAVA